MYNKGYQHKGSLNMSDVIKKSKDRIPVEDIRALLDYDPATGLFKWKHRDRRWFKTSGHASAWNRRWAHMPALTAKLHPARGDRKCYFVGHVRRITLTAHRVAFAHYHGRWPDFVVDHINGDTTDNRIENLREATHQQNAVNRAKSKSNTSGYTNITKTASGRYSVKVSVGVFDTLEQAISNYNDASEALHGEFALKLSL